MTASIPWRLHLISSWIEFCFVFSQIFQLSHPFIGTIINLRTFTKYVAILAFITETDCALYDVGAEAKEYAIRAQLSMRDCNSRSFRDKCRKLDISPITTYRLQSTVN